MSKAGGVTLALVVLAGCGDRDLKASIEKNEEAARLFESGQYTAAERKFGEAVSIKDENHLAWYNLGQTREKLDKYKEAAEAYSQAVKYRPDDAMYHYLLGKTLIGNDRCEAGSESNVGLAQTHLEEAVKLEPRLYKSWYCLGQVYFIQGEAKKAAEAWTKSAALNPYEGEAFIALGHLYIRWDKLAEAISVLDQGRLNVKDQRDQGEILFALGFAYEKQGNLDKAIENYSAALEKGSDNLSARRQRGFAYANKGDKAKAKVDLEAFVKAGGGGNSFELQAANERLLRMMAE
ncbi:MAG TPA: tetratricopeptide repeat protein [Candidatus Acidoferrum sp.]|nr:tetratricopeptide repeat protein [Candidatus Acidoferrum sp.]